ncbi:MAG: hypothetical protein QOE70_3618 [Chthoniobacter sp.]|nr:hypothetical protein [Chthoniobacter sp.]
MFLIVSASGPLLAVEGQARAEIEYLLGYIEKSNARFIRSGKEYSAKEGADHLRQKLARAGDRVKTAEDFIQGIATKSYLTGEAYQFKTADGKVAPTGPWLTEALARHRREDH